MKAGQSFTEKAETQGERKRLQRRIDVYQRRIHDLRTRILQKESAVEELVRRDAEISYLKRLIHKQADTIDALRHRTSWRYALPLRQFYGWVERTFFNHRRLGKDDSDTVRTVAFELEAKNDLDRDISLTGHWHATGDDPYFLLRPYRRRSFRGWYMVELLITGSMPQGMARFYFDSGDGFSETESMVIAFRNGQMAKRLYCFDESPVNIRFDPLESEGVFSVEHLHFSKVPKWFAVRRMIRKIKSIQYGFLGKSESEIRTALKQQAQQDGIPFVEATHRLYAQYFKSTSKNYAEWIETVEKPLLGDLDAIKEQIGAFPQRPLISVIVPVYNTKEPYLRRCIGSLLNQSYDHWELCIADDASTDKNLSGILDSYAQADSRIKLIFREKNGHISEASNSALELATGDFIALLDHDDELAGYALYFVAKAINENPQAAILYSDEDKIDEDGNRSHPHFKTQWNPDLLLSQNYISHLGVYSRELVRRVGGFRTGVEGSQDYDLLLRCVAQSRDEEIVHIPQVLYHWRVSEGSTAQAAGEKGYTTTAGVEALEHFVHLKKMGADVEIGPVPNTFRLIYQIQDPAPLVSLLIPTRDEVEVLSRCISSIVEKTTYANYEILILDNQSQDPETLDYFTSIQQKDNIKVISYDHPFNFSAINNFGAKHANGEILGLVNNDIEVISPEWLMEMVSHAIRPGIGCVGAKLYYPDGRIQHAGVILGIGGVAGHSHKYFQKSSYGYFSRLLLTQNVSAITAACLVVRKEVFDRVDGFDEENLAIAFNDVDFCLKVRMSGYRNVWTPYAELIHHESISRGEDDSEEKIERFNGETRYMKTKWKSVLSTDPYYSPHLSREKEDFSIG